MLNLESANCNIDAKEVLQREQLGGGKCNDYLNALPIFYGCDYIYKLYGALPGKLMDAYVAADNNEAYLIVSSGRIVGHQAWSLTEQRRRLMDMHSDGVQKQTSEELMRLITTAIAFHDKTSLICLKLSTGPMGDRTLLACHFTLLIMTTS